MLELCTAVSGRVWISVESEVICVEIPAEVVAWSAGSVGCFVLPEGVGPRWCNGKRLVIADTRNSLVIVVAYDVGGCGGDTPGPPRATWSLIGGGDVYGLVPVGDVGYAVYVGGSGKDGPGEPEVQGQ